jgi:DNA-binding response OmpR family regulator
MKNSVQTKILVTTGDGQLGSELVKILNREDFTADAVPTGEKALEKIWNDPPAILLLSLDLSGMSGLDVIRIIGQDARSRSISIITFSNEPDQAKILTAFNLNVDDYIASPFHPEELIARVKAVLSRKGPVNYQKEDALIKGNIRVHLAYHKVVCNGEDIQLTPKEYEVLTLLLKKEGRVLTREYLLEAIWGLSKDVSTRSVDMLVARLRKKLKKEGTRWIETVQGYGYRVPKTE